MGVEISLGVSLVMNWVCFVWCVVVVVAVNEGGRRAGKSCWIEMHRSRLPSQPMDYGIHSTPKPPAHEHW